MAVVLKNLRLSPSMVSLAIVVDIEGHPSALLPIHDPVQRFCTGRSLKKILLVADVIFVVDGTAIQRHNHFHIVRLVCNHVHRAAVRESLKMFRNQNFQIIHSPIISILSSNAANGNGQIQADPPHPDLTWWCC